MIDTGITWLLGFNEHTGTTCDTSMNVLVGFNGSGRTTKRVSFMLKFGKQGIRSSLSERNEDALVCSVIDDSTVIIWMWLPVRWERIWPAQLVLDASVFMIYHPLILTEICSG